MKKVLFITYFWPPSGKASAHWPLKVIKHLPEFGIEPVVLTVEEESFTQKDESLTKDIDPSLKVYRSKTFEPFDLYRKFIGKAKGENLTASETISKTNKSLSHLISIWIRMNLFIPDARVGWYFSAVKKGDRIFKQEKINTLSAGNNGDDRISAIVTIGPPHSAHLIGLTLSRRYSVPHYPVFIDPWVDIIYYKEFKRSKITRSLDNFFERKVLKNSKEAVFVTETMKHSYDAKYPFLKDKSHVLYWGYDEEAFSGSDKSVTSIEENEPDLNVKDDNVISAANTLEAGRTKRLHPIEKEIIYGKQKDLSGKGFIVHAGNIFDYQNPPLFWKKIKELIDKGENLGIKFIGSVSPVIKKAIEKEGLEDHTVYSGFLAYPDMLKELSSAKYLLVCASEPRHVPGKLFEYLRTGKPIIAFGHDNEEVKQILRNANAGMIFHYNEDAGLFFKNTGTFKTDLTYIKQFTRQNIARGLSKIIAEETTSA